MMRGFFTGAILLLAVLVSGCDSGKPAENIGAGEINALRTDINELGKKLGEMTKKIETLSPASPQTRHSLDEWNRANEEREEQALTNRLIHISSSWKSATTTALSVMNLLEEEVSQNDNGLIGEAAIAQWALDQVMGRYNPHSWSALKRGLWGQGAKSFLSFYESTEPVVLYFMPKRYVEWADQSHYIFMADTDWGKVLPLFTLWMRTCRFSDRVETEECVKNAETLSTAFGGRTLTTNDHVVIGFLARRHAEGGEELLKAVQAVALDIIRKKKRT